MSTIKKHISLLLSVCLLLCAALLGACAAGVNTKPVYDADGRLLEPESYGRVKLGQYKGLDVTETIVTASETALQISMEYERENFPDMSEDELKAYCEQKLADEMAKLAKDDAVAELVNKAIDNSSFSLNETAVEYHFQERLKYYQDMADVYGMSIEEFAANIVRNPDNFESEIRLFAEQTVKLVLLSEAIVEKEKLPYDASLTGDDAKSEMIDLASECIYKYADVNRVVN